jgi:Membrane bound beta barrel domain (DUF5777)
MDSPPKCNFASCANIAIAAAARFPANTLTKESPGRKRSGHALTLCKAPPYQPCSQPFATNVPVSFDVRPCANTFSIGFGAVVDVRPSVALVAEAIPTFVNETDLGIHRMPFSFGIQKKFFHHAFTFGFTTAPDTNTSQRIATRSIFLLEPKSDTPSGMFVGFDIMRQFP